MKRLAGGLIVLGGVLFAGGVSAQQEYPPAPTTTTVLPTTTTVLPTTTTTTTTVVDTTTTAPVTTTTAPTTTTLVPTVTVSSQTPSPGGPIVVAVTGCVDGELVTFTLDGATVSAVSSGGSATATLTAPTASGQYTIEVRCGDFVQSFTVTVGAQLPSTGSNGLNMSTGLALGLLALGAGVIGVTRLRRSRPLQH